MTAGTGPQPGHGGRLEDRLPIELREAVAVVRRLRTEARAAGIVAGDPLAPVLDAIAEAVAFVALERAAVDATAKRVERSTRRSGGVADTTRGGRTRVSLPVVTVALVAMAVVFGIGWVVGGRTASQMPPAWRDLAIWNAGSDLAALCRHSEVSGEQAGRRFCRIPLWIEPPLKTERE